MTAAATPLARAEAQRSLPLARGVVWAILGLTSALAVLLLLVSLVPSATVSGRIMGAAGEARAGVYSQDLAAYLDSRLRVAAVLLLVAVAGLVLLRATFEGLLAACFEPVHVRISRTTLMLVGVSTLVALVVRIPFLGQPMRYDEALSFNEFASRPLYYGLSFYPEPNNQLLNTFLMHLVYLGLGNQPWGLRLPALLGGVLLVSATFWLASELFDRATATFAATLVAVSSYVVEYSTNARGYTLQALCFVVMLALLVHGGRRALALAALVAAVGAYAIPTMLYGVVVCGVWLLVRKVRPREVVTAGLVIGLIVTLVYVPVIIVSGPDKLVSNRFVVPLEWTQFPGELGRTLAQTWVFWNRDVPWPLSLILLLGFAVTTVEQVRKREVPLGMLAPLVCLVLVLLQRVAPFERVWLFLLPLYLTLAAAGLARIADGRLLAGIFGIVLAYFTLTSGSILGSTETGVFPDAQAVTATLAPRIAPDDAVLTEIPASLPELQYYFPRYGLPINLLVRPSDEAQNLWVITESGTRPQMAGWSTATEVASFPGAMLYELRR